ncbi:MAG TPA: ribonucleoside-diphosphate reductase [Gammaproteobacteria bacterium]|nr:ribonucleoside-diphosphate reductase [Gammaproteobacteria bacterium]
MKSVQLKAVPASVADIPLQDASLDIWDKKYRLKRKDGAAVDQTIDDTYKRVARALAEVEVTPEKREHWYEQFLWALRHGAIPAGRITSNAGALEHKPATSTINCTVSGTIHDSMNNILERVHEAGLTLKAGCGIGYEFSTLRPKGAYVSGAGAYTSGPLSFMDIYDKMCFTVSSAGGRRGAQMATFDVGHPDVMDFVRAKREDGRLRQFNLSLLITREFMQAVTHDTEWKLAFPLTQQEVEDDDIDLYDTDKVIWREWPIHEGYIANDSGLVACKIYRCIRARRLWDMIMASTYDFAEPGFILIDKVNEMNNNWFDENIRATNPCVTGDTWVHTAGGPRQVRDLIGRPFRALVDGRMYPSGRRGFFKTATKMVYRLRTAEGYTLRLTADHRVRRVTRYTREGVDSEWCEARALRAGDRIVLHDHRANTCWGGDYTWDQGYLLGGLVAGGTPMSGGAVRPARQPVQVASGGGVALPGRDEFRLATVAHEPFASELGMIPASRRIMARLEASSSECHRGFLRGLFDRGAVVEGASVRLSPSDRPFLEAVQRMLLRLGIASSIDHKRRGDEHVTALPDGRGDGADQGANTQHELVIDGENLLHFHDQVGFSDPARAEGLRELLAVGRRGLKRERFVARVVGLDEDGCEDVYDVQVPGIHTFDANGLHAHNCGEQPLPPYGSCLLGSVNLTKFVREPFSENAHFDWEEFRRVVSVFTRMLDNVVEINGLPLDQQREEILRKRRHGMGFLGLGSTLTMLRMKYGEKDSVAFTEKVSRELALTGWQTALELAEEKGPAPILEESFEVTPELLRKRPEMKLDGYEPGDRVPGRILHARYSRYMQQLSEIAPELVDRLAETGARFTHHSSIAPTGTISLSLANNASNGIEPSFAHHYFRNVIREGRKTKEKVDVYSFELLAYRSLVDPEAQPDSEDPAHRLPEYFIAADDVTPRQHVDIQAAAQKWVDSSISKTANVPTDYPFDEFKDIYLYAYEQGLKGCTTFRFNPEAFQGVLVKEKDLENTTYRFTLEDGSVVELKGNEEVEYDGEVHTAANLYDALKEGYYGKF